MRLLPDLHWPPDLEPFSVADSSEFALSWNVSRGLFVIASAFFLAFGAFGLVDLSA